MQWREGLTAGFSTADPSRLYLPVDPDPDRPTVACQEDDPASTLNLVRSLVALRRATPVLQGRAATRVVADGYPFAWVRGETHLVVVNPRREPARLDVPEAAGAALVWGSGVQPSGAALDVAGFGYGVLTLAGP
jgi:maltose alpha-D-glucosyltransferase/alpha-amylase